MDPTFQNLVARTSEDHLASMSPLGGGAAAELRNERSLDFEQWHQQMNNWCWAAVSSAIGNFYAGQERWTQCAVASQCLTQMCCPTAAICDLGWYLDRALAAVGHPATLTWPLDMIGIEQEIAKGTPIGVRIQWPDPDKGHFVVIEGYSRSADGDVVFVEDPWTGSHNVDFDELNAAYSGIGSWSHTYLTQP